jgi:hypothetical protein
MIGGSIVGARRGAALGSACLWFGLGCSGTSGREGLARLTVDDASTDVSVDSSVVMEDEAAADASDDRPHRRKPGALEGGGLDDDASLSTDGALADGGDGAVPVSCGLGVVATAPACDGCTNQCALADECNGCGMLQPSFSRYLPFCSKLVGVAADGPAKGESRVKLCSELLDCVVRTGCVFFTNGMGGAGTWSYCYCGHSQMCFQVKLGPGEGGPCQDQIENAAETTVPALIASRFTQQGTMVSPSNLALGAVMAPIRPLAQECTGPGGAGETRCIDPSVDAGH